MEEIYKDGVYWVKHNREWKPAICSSWPAEGGGFGYDWYLIRSMKVYDAEDFEEIGPYLGVEPDGTI